MKTIIAGSRSITDYALVERVVLESGFVITEVVCGMANGVDKIGKLWAENNRIPVAKFYAKWDDFTVKPCHIKVRYDGTKYNSFAGHIRNKEMALYADQLILIWDGKSTGSQSMLKLAKDNGLRIYILKV